MTDPDLDRHEWGDEGRDPGALPGAGIALMTIVAALFWAAVIAFFVIF